MKNIIEKLRLLVPSEGLQEEWKDAVSEMTTPDGHITPYAVRRDAKTYEEFLNTTRGFASGIGIPEGKVPSELFFLCREGEKRILGAIDIRHELNDYLFRFGGHIGYGIRPSEQRKGYATIMLGMALDHCRRLGMERVLVTCDEDNVGSRRTIEKNGGILENIVLDGSDRVMRFWIDLTTERHPG